MLKLEIRDLKKYYGDKNILDIDDAKIYANDKIGLVGRNGAGKTTLLKIIKGEIVADTGYVKKYDKLASIDQLECDVKMLDIESKKEKRNFDSPDEYSEVLSGGEKTRMKIVNALGQESGIIIADEPSSNLDMNGVETLVSRLKKYRGALIIVSHDRYLLDEVCNKIVELESGKLKIYEGNYSDYLFQKEAEIKAKTIEYESYEREKKKLESAVLETKNQSKTIRKAPKRMGNSEARLHKMGNQRAKKNLDQKAKAIKKRLEKLEVKEKPMDIESIKLDLKSHESIHSKIILESKSLKYGFGDRVLFDDAKFQIYRGSKIAIMGDNGSGKTTLLRLIEQGHDSIKRSKVLKIGYFRQDLSILDDEKTLLENMKETSDMSETMIRTLLARLLFKRDEVYKKVAVLSGGERVKASFAKLILQDVNLLILDEPTNYLDLDSVKALENVLIDYKGSLVFVSHDRKFVENIATDLLMIENRKLNAFTGTYEEYMKRSKKTDTKDSLQEELMRVKHQITTILGRLCMPTSDDDVEALDAQYDDLLIKKKEIESRM
jgi:macrolide transport system ATP-binding/permease protein